jgi:hypothetical protein
VIQFAIGERRQHRAGMTARGLFVTGTDTGVGKTRVAVALIHSCARRAAGGGDEAGVGGQRPRWTPIHYGLRGRVESYAGRAARGRAGTAAAANVADLRT